MSKTFKNLAEQLEYEHIQDLKKNHEGAYSVELDKTGICYIRILNRGEQMFYQENDRAFICEISVLHDIVFSKSIKKWDNGEKVTEQEKNDIKNKITFFFKQYHNTDIKFV